MRKKSKFHLLGIIGYPLRQSMSPILHNYWMIYRPCLLLLVTDVDSHEGVFYSLWKFVPEFLFPGAFLTINHKISNFSHFCWILRVGLYEMLIGKWPFRLKWGVNQLCTTSRSGDIENDRFLPKWRIFSSSPHFGEGYRSLIFLFLP